MIATSEKIPTEREQWLWLGGAPSDLMDKIVAVLMRECGATGGDAHFAAAIAIDETRLWIIGRPEESPDYKPTSD